MLRFLRIALIFGLISHRNHVFAAPNTHNRQSEPPNGVQGANNGGDPNQPSQNSPLNAPDNNPTHEGRFNGQPYDGGTNTPAEEYDNQDEPAPHQGKLESKPKADDVNASSVTDYDLDAWILYLCRTVDSERVCFKKTFGIGTGQMSLNVCYSYEKLSSGFETLDLRHKMDEYFATNNLAKQSNYMQRAVQCSAYEGPNCSGRPLYAIAPYSPVESDKQFVRAIHCYIVKPRGDINWAVQSYAYRFLPPDDYHYKPFPTVHPFRESRFFQRRMKNPISGTEVMDVLSRIKIQHRTGESWDRVCKMF